VIISAAIGMIFLAGVPMRFFLPLVALCISAVALIVTLEPYRLARLTAFANPWEHQFGSGYQLTQALIAFGRGEWIGLGLGNSIQKLFFLPEAHTDFLFSIIAEELGVVGAGLVIVLFAWLVVRGLLVGRAAQAKSLDFHAYLAYGIALILGIQACVNLGVNLGLLPTKGLTLPMMSYGGNSLIVSCMMIAVLLRIDYETRAFVEDKRGSRRG
jgi:cell division protein FtsW